MTTKIYAAMANELLVAASRRNGHWETDRQLIGASAQCVAVDPLKPEVVLWHV
jgi:hypothetical protein